MDHGLRKYAHALLRIGAGLWLVEHGLQKEFGPIGVLELAGGTLLVAGLFTRPVALVLMVETLVLSVVAHASQGRWPWPLQSDVELGLLAALVLASVAATGAGPFSVDELIHSLRRERRRSETNDRRNPYAVSL